MDEMTEHRARKAGWCIAVVSFLTIITFLMLYSVGDAMSAIQSVFNDSSSALLVEYLNGTSIGVTAAVFFWTVSMLIVGGVWVRSIEPHWPLSGQLVGSLVMGSLITVLGFVFPLLVFSVTATSENIATLEPFMVDTYRTIYTSNMAESYIVASALITFVLGVMVLIARQIILIPRSE